jgi:hypothetical protein
VSNQHQPTTSQALLTLKQAAVLLGFCIDGKNWRVSFHRWLRRYRFPVVRLSPRRFRIRPEVITAYVEKREVGSIRLIVGISAYRAKEAA